MPVDSSVVLLSNPTSGTGNPALTAAYAVARLRQLDLDVEHLVATSYKHALELAENAIATRPLSLVLVGGDGLLSAVLPALIGSSVPVALVPAGRGNDTALALGIPTDDATLAADVAAAHHTTRIDVGRVEAADGRTSYFTTVVTADSSVEVSQRATRLMRVWKNPYAWSVAGVTSLLRPHSFRFTLDGERVVETRAALAAVGNGPSYGAGLQVCPEADMDDGVLDLTVIDYNPVAWTTMIGSMTTSRRVTSSGMSTYRASTIDIEYLEQGPRPFQADGEIAGELPARVTVLPRALEVIIP